MCKCGKEKAKNDLFGEKTSSGTTESFTVMSKPKPEQLHQAPWKWKMHPASKITAALRLLGYGEHIFSNSYFQRCATTANVRADKSPDFQQSSAHWHQMLLTTSFTDQMQSASDTLRYLANQEQKENAALKLYWPPVRNARVPVTGAIYKCW